MRLLRLLFLLTSLLLTVQLVGAFIITTYRNSLLSSTFHGRIKYETETEVSSFRFSPSSTLKPSAFNRRSINHGRSTRIMSSIQNLADSIREQHTNNFTSPSAISEMIWFGLDKEGNDVESLYDTDVSYFQRSTGKRVKGLTSLISTTRQWEENFNEEFGIDDYDVSGTTKYKPTCKLTRVSVTSPNGLLIQWNLTYVSPTVQWLENLGIACGWNPSYQSYNDQAGIVRTFSYTKVLQLFQNAIQTGSIRVPLACIQGTTAIETSKLSTTTTKDIIPQISSITEDLSYAQDLQRGVLQNRVCAQDLQFFLETARRPIDITIDDWTSSILTLLPFTSVPGLLDPLAVDPNNDDDRWVPAIFLSIVTVTTLLFATFAAPELIGQSIWSNHPTYIIPPSELNEIIPY